MSFRRKRVLALIPARGGSVRVPGKNLRLLNGNPLIAFTIEAACAAKSVDRILVTTDSKEIAAIARQFGAETPFLRPKEIAQSLSTEMEFLLHALDWLKDNERYEPDLIVLLYPTAPFRRPESIDRAVRIMQDHPEVDSLRSIRLCSEHPYKMWQIEGDYLQPFIRNVDANMHTWSFQRLPEVYIQNANIYITRPRTILEKGSPTGNVIIPFVMSEEESIDINTPLDFLRAEQLLADKKRILT